MVAVAWFRPDEWRELKRICPDLQDTYDEWLANAEAGVAAWGGEPEHSDDPINDGLHQRICIGFKQSELAVPRLKRYPAGKGPPF